MLPPAEPLLLRAGIATLEVDANQGGRMTSLRIGETELIGYAGKQRGQPAGILWGSFVMAPFVGRCRNGEFIWDRQHYRLPRNMAPHAIHGLVFDRPWEIEGPASMAIELDERWPFGGKVKQHFELAPDSLTVTATLSNERRAMPAVLGFHPWLRRRLPHGSEAILKFRPHTQYCTDAEGIPTGRRAKAGPRPWDASFYRIEQPPLIRWPGVLALRFESPAEHWIICETEPAGLCVEPLTGPVDGLNSAEAAVVEPGQPLTLQMRLHWIPEERSTH